VAVDAGWTFLTNHGHVLLAVAAKPDARVEEIAERVGISARGVLAIVKDLEEADYVVRTRVGRRTHYAIQAHRPFRHPAVADHEIDALLAVFGSD
jgi:DNA-binding Lrp family transcriptional regulator